MNEKRKINKRADHKAGIRMAYERTRKRILATANGEICYLCGMPLDTSVPFGRPDAVVIDHVQPISKGGSVLDSDNMRPVHDVCNKIKGNRNVIYNEPKAQKADNSNLPLTIDWTRYRSNADGSSNSEQLLEEANAIRRSGQELTAKGLRTRRL